MHVKNIKIIDDSIEIGFEGQALNEIKNIFQIFSGDKLIIEQETSKTKIRLKPYISGISHFSILVNRSPDTISLNIDYTPDSVLRKQGRNNGNLYEIITNTLVSSFRLYNVQDWAIKYWGDDTVHVAAETGRILKDSIQLREEDSSTKKVLKIARFILKRTAGKEGVPSNELSGLHPLKQLSYIRDGKSKVWCGNFSSIFSFLASSAGLPVRLVSCGLNNGQYINGGHVFCEVYLKEDRSWVYVDLTSRNILVRYNKKWLNVIDIQRLLRFNIQDTNWIAWHYEKDSLYETPFFKVADLATYYFHPNNTFVFYYADFLRIMTPEDLLLRVTKIFYTKPYYAIYSDNFRYMNYSFYLRVFTNYLLIPALLFCLYKIIRGLISNRNVGKSI
jgi:hypothetical protein